MYFKLDALEQDKCTGTSPTAAEFLLLQVAEFSRSSSNIPTDPRLKYPICQRYSTLQKGSNHICRFFRIGFHQTPYLF